MTLSIISAGGQGRVSQPYYGLQFILGKCQPAICVLISHLHQSRQEETESIGRHETARWRSKLHGGVVTDEVGQARKPCGGHLTACTQSGDSSQPSCSSRISPLCKRENGREAREASNRLSFISGLLHP
jgi:hypothetical protein